MSASIHWRRVAKQGPRLREVNAPSRFIEAMARAFGAWPLRLDSAALPVLRGMAAAADSTDAASYEEVIKLIEEQDEIELTAMY